MFQLSEVFETEIDPVMQSLGYCCGRKYTFNPQVLCCYGKQLCTIPRDAKYYSYQNRYVTVKSSFFLAIKINKDLVILCALNFKKSKHVKTWPIKLKFAFDF